MRVFVTGASGFIGKAVTKELINAGHTVLGLARSTEKADELKELGAEVQRGSLENLQSLKDGAAASDGVIHLAFHHDFTNYEKSCELDRAAISAIGEALAGTNRPFLTTSGTMTLPHGRRVTEDDVPDPSFIFAKFRGQSETLTKDLTSKGIRTMIMRPPPTVHGDYDPFFMALLIKTTKEKGVAAYVGDGLNTWPTVHVLDAAVAYRLALEKGTAGSAYHTVAEEGVKMKDIMEKVGKKLKLPVESKSGADAEEHFGMFAYAIGSGNLSSSEKTRKALGWKPEHRTLLEDLEHGTYFDDYKIGLDRTG